MVPLHSCALVACLLFFALPARTQGTYENDKGLSLNWFGKTQTCRSTSFVLGSTSPYTDLGFTYRDAGDYAFYSDAATGRVTMNNSAYQQYTSSEGTHLVTRTWDNATQTLTGPMACFINPEGTYFNDMTAYRNIRKIGTRGVFTLYAGLVAHAVSCGKLTSFVVEVGPLGDVSSFTVSTPLFRGVGSPDTGLVSHVRVECGPNTQQAAPAEAWVLPAICANPQDLCSSFDI